MGVRPIFKLDTADILFAAELMEHNSISRVDQMEADNGNIYRDEDALPNGGHGGVMKAFKLTLLSSSVPGIGASLAYDLDETVSGITDTVAVNPGEELGFDVTGASGDELAYKIVRNDGVLSHYGHDGYMDSVFIVADDINTEQVYSAGGTLVDNTNYAHLNSGSLHTTSVWAQKNYPTQSHEGSAPISFTLKVLDDHTAPALGTISALRNSNASAVVKFNIAEGNQKGKYYYVVDPGTAPASFTDFALSNKTPFSSAGETLLTLPVHGSADTPYTIYIIAKDQVRNISNILAVEVPKYVAPHDPVAKTGVEADLAIGETVTFDAYAIATDLNLPNDALTITAIDPSSTTNVSIADTSLAAGILSISGISSGQTNVVVTVWDEYPGANPVSVTIAITVHEPAPQITIDYITEELNDFIPGAEYSFNNGDAVEMGSGMSIPEEWFDTTVSIVKINAAPSPNSAEKLLYIPPRPAPPAAIQGVKESLLGFNDGQILGVNDSMEYKVDTLTVWTPLRPGVRVVDNLLPGDYHVRYGAIAGKSFAGRPDTVTIGWGMTVPDLARAVYLPAISGVTVSPAPGVHYASATGDFTFSIKANVPPLVSTNRILDNVRETLEGTPNADGGYDYVIRNVSGSIPVVVYIQPDPLGSEVTATQAVWTHDGRIYVETWRNGTVSVHAPGGQLVRRVHVTEGLASIPVGRGIYIVTVDGTAGRKVVVR
jgi:hypothetical protein